MKLVLGLTVSIVLGGLVTGLMLWGLRKWMRLGEKPESVVRRVPPWLTGAVERLFFTLLVAYDVSGSGPAMVGWLALKFATNWNHPDWAKDPRARAFAFSALLAGLLSMLFALLGGRVAGGKAW